MLWYCIFTTAIGTHIVLRRQESDDPLNPHCVPYEDDFADLADDKINLLVYFGRREYITTLNAYIERDLRRNGGVVDRVLWALVRYTTDDVRYLAALQRRNPDVYVIPPIKGGGWDVVWRLANEPGTYYIKVDDDIQYIAPGAIAELVREKKRNRFLFISGNVINHGVISSVHQELAQIPWLKRTPNWRAPWRFHADVLTDPRFSIEHHYYSECIWRRWDCAALAHEAFFHRLQTNTSCAWDFGIFDFHSHGYGTMDDGRGRKIDWNINFFIFRKEDIDDLDWDFVAHDDDEVEFSIRHPQKREQHCAALGRAVVVHFSFGSQEKGLKGNTSLLNRYFELAELLIDENAEKFYGGQRQPDGRALMRAMTLE